jgi:endonuclease III related protein
MKEMRRFARGRDSGLVTVYERLRRRFGHAGWWPARSPFEVCLGAILTQNTAWPNVEKALGALRARRWLSYRALQGRPAADLAPVLRSAGTYRVKARRVAAFVEFLGSAYRGRVEGMAGQDAGVLRRQLLAVHGIGRETADAIALYAAGRPLFVIDAYTRRVFSRLGRVSGTEPYDALQRYFMDGLPRSAPLYNDYHAQIVRLAKDHCRARPRCGGCPLEDLCPKHGVSLSPSSPSPRPAPPTPLRPPPRRPTSGRTGATARRS